MGLELLVILFAIWTQAAPRLPAPALDVSGVARFFATAPTFRPHTREVTNWRWQAAARLDATPSFAMAVVLGQTPAAVSRCVKLNNYWCIKRAGWAGEIAADTEGHVAFASALEGARTAALLLRRYYVDFGRHSAMAIVSHWAPAQCGISIGGSIKALAVRGLGSTLRARWLASHRAGVKVRARRSIVPDRPIPMLRTPTIEAGVSEIRLAPVSLAALGDSPAPKAGARPAIASCAGETQRIASYAAQAANGIAKVDEDLHLFDADGNSTSALRRLMANMAGVEIGPLRASGQLIDAGIAAVGSNTAAGNSTTVGSRQ